MPWADLGIAVGHLPGALHPFVDEGVLPFILTLPESRRGKRCAAAANDENAPLHVPTAFSIAARARAQAEPALLVPHSLARILPSFTTM
jgi:hypothetical protein